MADARAELRARLDADTGRLDAEDVARARSSDWWLDGFLRKYDGDVDTAYPALVECLVWRREHDINHMSVLELKPQLEAQMWYINGSDRNGTPLLWFNAKTHKKDTTGKAAQRLFVYWLETYYFATQGQSIVVLFDMTSAGLQNMDFDLIRYLLHCLKHYYPGSLEYLLVYNIPFILNAAWKVIKGWLDPAAQKRILFVNKDSLKKHIDADQLPEHMGGSSRFHFTMDHLATWQRQFDNDTAFADCAVATTDETAPAMAVAADTADQQAADFVRQRVRLRVAAPHAAAVQRTVQFDAQQNVDAAPSPPTTHDASETPRAATRKASLRLLQLTDARLSNFDELSHRVSNLAICPKDELVLEQVNGESDYVDALILKNVAESRSVLFKIKTTSPDKFRVRPSAGCIKPSAFATVRVFLHKTVQPAKLAREKFLIMVADANGVEAASSVELSDMWKAVDAANVSEHRLRCRILVEPSLKPIENNTTADLRLRNSTAGCCAAGHKCQSEASLEQIRKLRFEVRLTMIITGALLILATAVFFNQTALRRDIAQALSNKSL